MVEKISHSNAFGEQQKLDILQELTLNKIDQLLDFFGVNYKNWGGRITAKCPIHNGNNPNAFCLYVNSGIWQCFTRNCQQNKGKTLIGLVRALLLKQFDRRFISNRDLIDFLVKFNGADLSNLKVDENYQDKKDFINQFKGIEKREIKGKTDRRYIRSKLVIPSEYYIKRGYLPATLNEFDIGECLNPDLPLFKRAITPIYDKNEMMVGCTGRATNGESPKWLEGGKFDKTSILYNCWKARDYIRKKDSIILVESPGNVWRLCESGFKNSVALLGANLFPMQFNLIHQLGISHIICCLDNDEAGRKCSENIVKMAGKLYKITDINIAESPYKNFNDVGDLTREQVSDLFNSYNIFP